MYNGKNQRKTSQPVQLKTRGAAPPVYRPNPVPRVCQLKTATPQPKAVAGNRVAQAPPVYRPQPVPKVLQRKVAGPPASTVRTPGKVPAMPGKVIQRNIDSTDFERSARRDPRYMIDPTARETLYSEPTAPAPRPLGLYSKRVEQDDATNSQVYAWKPNVRFLSRAEMGFDSRTLMYGSGVARRRLDLGGLFRQMGQRQEPGATEQSAFGMLGKNDCVGFAQALHWSIARESYRGESDDEDTPDIVRDLQKEEEPDFPAISVGDMMVHRFVEPKERRLHDADNPGASVHGATVVAEDGNRKVILEADVRRDSTAPQFHFRDGVADFVAVNIRSADQPSKNVAVTKYRGGKLRNMDLRRYDLTKTDPSSLTIGVATSPFPLRSSDFSALGRLLAQARWDTEGVGWFGSRKTPDGIAKMRTAYSQGDYMEVFRIAETKNGTVDSDRSDAVRKLYRYLSALGKELTEAYVHPALVRVRMAQLERWRL